MFSDAELKELEIKIRKLEKKDIDLIISDFDDTIFCTKEAVESDVRKWRRWNEWNQYILDVIWVKKFIDMFYTDRDFPKTIVSKLRKNHDLILTAWYEEIQLEKIKACKLDYLNYRIVYDPEDKIIETIKYVVEYLKFLPSKITIYEDRPKFYMEYQSFLEDFLWIDVDIIYVEMIDNISEPKLKKIEA